MKTTVRHLFPTFLAVVLSVACVTVDAKTGEKVPRGNQKHEFDVVVERAEGLEKGLSRAQVLLMLGSPAEQDPKGNIWVYLPERPAVIVPARALRLEFVDGRLADFGYRAIVLGQRL
jgi:outer membrane protein assembly factor BamE (lipoprotein component of BamABCDE complex)